MRSYCLTLRLFAAQITDVHLLFASTALPSCLQPTFNCRSTNLQAILPRLLVAAMTKWSVFIAPLVALLATSRALESSEIIETRSDAIANIPLDTRCSVYKHDQRYPTIPNPKDGTWISLIATQMHNKQQSGSCALTQDAHSVDGTTIRWQIEPYHDGSDDCKSTAEIKTDRNGLTSAINQLRQAGASAGCCVFKHGGGTYRSDVRFRTTNDFTFGAIPCPSF